MAHDARRNENFIVCNMYAFSSVNKISKCLRLFVTGLFCFDYYFGNWFDKIKSGGKHRFEPSKKINWFRFESKTKKNGAFAPNVQCSHSYVEKKKLKWKLVCI